MSDEATPTEKLNGVAKKRTHNPQNYPEWWDAGETLRGMARDVELHINVVRRILAEGGIAGVTSSDGTFQRFPPGTTEKLRALITQADQIASAKAARDPGETSKEIIDGGTALLRQAHGHIEKVFGLVIQPMARALDALEKSHAVYAERCAKLEADRDRVADERERLLNEASYRAMAEKQVEGEEQRKNEAWGLVMKGVPTLVEQVKKSIVAGDPKVKEQLHAAIELLQSMKPDQLEALSMIDGFLTDDQKANIRKILEHRPGAAPSGVPGSKESRPVKPADTTKGK